MNDLVTIKLLLNNFKRVKYILIKYFSKPSPTTALTTDHSCPLLSIATVKAPTVVW